MNKKIDVDLNIDATSSTFTMQLSGQDKEGNPFAVDLEPSEILPLVADMAAGASLIVSQSPRLAAFKPNMPVKHLDRPLPPDDDEGKPERAVPKRRNGSLQARRHLKADGRWHRVDRGASDYYMLRPDGGPDGSHLEGRATKVGAGWIAMINGVPLEDGTPFISKTAAAELVEKVAADPKKVQEVLRQAQDA